MTPAQFLAGKAKAKARVKKARQAFLEARDECREAAAAYRVFVTPRKKAKRQNRR